MKRYISILLCSLCISVLSAQTQMQVDNLAAFCKVWGFLKYYHPYPSKKSVEWDKVLVDNYSKVKAARNKQEFNAIIEGITNMCGPLKTNRHPFNPADSLAINADFKWIYDTTVFSAQVCKYLQSVKTNHKPFKNKYVGRNALWDGNTKIKELSYPAMPYPDEAYRYLALARYWNIIDYYFPDKYLMDSTWNSSLLGAIPIFIQAKDTLEYYRALQWITARTNDSHGSGVRAQFLFKYKYPPFNTFYWNDTMVVYYLRDDSIARLCNIRKGDIVLSIDGRPVKDIWDDIKIHHAASNKNFLEYYYGSGFEATSTRRDSSVYVLLREGKEIRTIVKNYTLGELIGFKKSISKYKQPPPFEIRYDSVSGKKYGYMCIGTMKNKEIKKAFKELKGVDYLIIDDRGYPWKCDFSKLLRHMLHGKYYVAAYTQPDYSYPGYIKYYPHPSVTSFSAKVGTKSNNYYKGKVIILITHSTMSAAEYFAMALKIIPNSVVIGNQTAGADGNVATVVFPGNYSVWFTGLGWFYADWKQTQRVGILSDINVDYTVKDRLNGEDVIMQRALQYIRTGK